MYARSLFNEIDTIHYELNKVQLDIINLGETWLCIIDDAFVLLLKIRNYSDMIEMFV